jgi:curved DNA-binding protein CbpA
MDLYKVLDVRKNASVKTIKKAYHEKVLKHHPDKNPKADVRKFHEILAAYEILIDDEKRKQYDNLNKDDSTNISLIFSKILSKIDSVAAFNKMKVQFTNILNNPKNIMNVISLISKEDISFDDILDILSNLKTNNILSTETETYTESKSKTDSIKIGGFNNEEKEDELKGGEDGEIDEEEVSDYQQEVDKNKLNIELNINTNMKDVYNDKSQEITFMRKINNKDKKETVKVPLICDQVVFDSLGDQNDKNLGDLIVNVNITNNMKYKKRDNDLIIRFEISLYQLFNGLIFSFIHLDDEEITIEIDCCFKYGFDGNKFKYIIENKGLLDTEGKRGKLIIQFILTKDSHFDEKLLRFFG